jgi:hypothetical protein
MRRTFQDLGRAASVHDFVVRAISGHATTSMQEHYSSVSGDEAGGYENLPSAATVTPKKKKPSRRWALGEREKGLEPTTSTLARRFGSFSPSEK